MTKKIKTKKLKNVDIKLGNKDAALVILANGGRKLYLPAQDQEDRVNNASFDIVALALAFDDSALMNKLRNRLHKEAKRVEDEVCEIDENGDPATDQD